MPCSVFPEPKFVDVFWIPESENPDDDKIYFFFRETAVERQQGLGKSSFARIGQICRVRAPHPTQDLGESSCHQVAGGKEMLRSSMLGLSLGWSPAWHLGRTSAS